MISLVVIVMTMGIAFLMLSFPEQVKAGGLEDGQSEAENDFINSAGEDKDPDCNAENGVNYCTAYKVGYNTRWAHMEGTYDCSSGVCK